MIELMEYCGFESQEINAELPRVKKAFLKLGITDEDIDKGKKRLKTYYDIELDGVRKVLRLILKEHVNSLLLKEEGKKKIIYGFMSPGIDIFGSALMSQSKEVYSIHHCWALHIIIGCIFDKIVPLLEAAEDKWLKDGIVAHCGNVKTLLGPLAFDLIPKPDLLVTTGYLCETSSKTLDLMHEFFNIPVHSVDTCMDREIGAYQEESKRVEGLAAKSLKKLAERIREVTDIEITDDLLWEAMDAKSRLDNALAEVKMLVANSDPLLLSPTHENIWMCLKHLTLGIDGYGEAADAINILYEELKERAGKGLGVVEKGAPRILAMLPAGQTDPRMEHLACEVGLALVIQDTVFRIPYNDKPKDPYEAIVGHLGFSLYTTLPRRIPLIIEGCKNFNLDGVLDRFHSGCRAVAGDALIIKDAVSKEMGIPVLLLEWENFDPRAYDHNELKRKFEVFKAMIQANKSN